MAASAVSVDTSIEKTTQSVSDLETESVVEQIIP